MLEEEIEETYDYWNDKNFVDELNKRSAELRSGKVKGVKWEDARAQILSSSKKRKRS